MAKPEKKAELDKEGIRLSAQDKKGKLDKADLDQDGLALPDRDKVALDQEDVSLSHAKQEGKEEGEGEVGDTPQGRERLPRRTILIIAAASAVVLLMAGVGGGLWYRASHKVKETKPVAQVQTVKPSSALNQREIVLDPFMILCTPQKQGKAGLLIAQVTLQVNPKTSANVQDKLFEIRTIIADYLTKNVQIYTEYEITEMIREALRPFDVTDVAFTRYDLK
jgi:flagellar basal body-associated protein FliL